MTTPGSSRPAIPNKLYFRIGEVSELTGAQPYTLRHWEMEFPTLSPKKNPAGQRLYRREDIETVREIQRLLHSEGYTTAGARRLLKARGRNLGSAAPRKAPVEAAPERESRKAVPPPPAAGEVSPEGIRRLGTTAREALDLMDENDRALAQLLEGFRS